MAWIESNRIDHTGRAIGLVSAIGKGLFDGIRARQADDQIALARDDFNLRKTDSDFNRNEGFNESVRQFDINAGVNQQNADTASLNATTNKRNTDLNYSIDNRDVKAKKATQSLLFEKDAVAERNKVLVKTFNDDKAKLGKFDMTFSSWLKDSKKVTDKEYDDIARYNDVDFKKFFGMLGDAPDLQEDLLKRRDKIFSKKQTDYVTKAAGDKGFTYKADPFDPYGWATNINPVNTDAEVEATLGALAKSDDAYTLKTQEGLGGWLNDVRFQDTQIEFAGLPKREREKYAVNAFSPDMIAKIKTEIKGKDTKEKEKIIKSYLDKRIDQEEFHFGGDGKWNILSEDNPNLKVMAGFESPEKIILKGLEPEKVGVYTRSQDSIKADDILGLMDSFTEIKTAKDKEFNKAVGLLKATRDEGFKQNRLGLIEYSKGLSGDISTERIDGILNNNVNSNVTLTSSIGNVQKLRTTTSNYKDMDSKIDRSSNSTYSTMEGLLEGLQEQYSKLPFTARLDQLDPFIDKLVSDYGLDKSKFMEAVKHVKGKETDHKVWAANWGTKDGKDARGISIGDMQMQLGLHMDPFMAKGYDISKLSDILKYTLEDLAGKVKNGDYKQATQDFHTGGGTKKDGYTGDANYSDGMSNTSSFNFKNINSESLVGGYV